MHEMEKSLSSCILLSVVTLSYLTIFLDIFVEQNVKYKEIRLDMFGNLIIFISPCFTLKGVLHLLPQKTPKLACFVLYLKIINIFLNNVISVLQWIVLGIQK